MINLKQSLTQPLTKAHSGLVVLFLVVALIGFADAGFLAVEHYRGVIPPCELVSGCEEVLTSSYSFILGVPVSLLGTLYYLAVSICVLIFLESKHVTEEVKAHHTAILKWSLVATLAGLLMSAWFVYVQAFIIGSYCLYCLGSALTSTLLFIIAAIIFHKDARGSETL
ncbi:MAG: vitamin K epoxide reductase family protein [Candidatus Paceibacterota bacterium]